MYALDSCAPSSDTSPIPPPHAAAKILFFDVFPWAMYPIMIYIVFCWFIIGFSISFDIVDWLVERLLYVHIVFLHILIWAWVWYECDMPRMYLCTNIFIVQGKIFGNKPDTLIHNTENWKMIFGIWLITLTVIMDGRISILLISCNGVHEERLRLLINDLWMFNHMWVSEWVSCQEEGELLWSTLPILMPFRYIYYLLHRL